MIDHDVDGLGPGVRFLPEPLAGGGVERDGAVGFWRQGVGEILDEGGAGKKLVHGGHTALNKKERMLAPCLESVAEAEEAAKGISVGSKMGEKDGVLGESEAIDNFLGHDLVHEVNLENGGREVEHGTAYLREDEGRSKLGR